MFSALAMSCLLQTTAAAAPAAGRKTAPALIRLAAGDAVRPLVAGRARLTVTKTEVRLRPLQGPERTLAVLQKGKVPANLLNGRHLVRLDDALNGGELLDLADDEARVEVAVDAEARWDVVNAVLTSAGIAFAFVVATPTGEQAVELELPVLSGDPPEASLTLAVEGGQLYLRDGTTQKATTEAVRAAVRAFVDGSAHGRPPRQRMQGSWTCPAPAGKDCWHGQAALSAASAVAWGDLLPLAAQAKALMPNVVFASF